MKINTKQIGDDLYSFNMMTTRCIKLFFRDKMNVMFALLSPMIVLVLYVLFLGDMQLETVQTMLNAQLENMLGKQNGISDSVIKGFIDSWMVSGVITVAIITVSLSANNVMVEDKSRGVLADGIASPAKQWIIKLSYYFFNFVVTISIVGVALCACFIYLGATGGFYMTASEVFALIGTILLGSLSATSVTVFISGFFKNNATLGAFGGIVGAGIGFLTGAFMPMSIMPSFARGISIFVPGSHTGGIIRNLMMNGALENIGSSLPKGIPESVVTAITENLAAMYDFKLDAFGTMIGISDMFIVLITTTIAMVIISFGYSYGKKIYNKDKKIKAQISAINDKNI